MAHDSNATAKEHGPSIPLIIGVGVALLVLATATYLAAGVELGGWSTVIEFAIATIKAALIVAVFMELGYHGGGSRFVFAISIFFVLLLITFVVMDVDTRFAPSRPPGPHPSLEGKGAPAFRFQGPTQTGGPRGPEQ